MNAAEEHDAMKAEAAEVWHADARELIGTHALEGEADTEPVFDFGRENVDASEPFATSATDLGHDDAEWLARGDGGEGLGERGYAENVGGEVDRPAELFGEFPRLRWLGVWVIREESNGIRWGSAASSHKV